MRARARRAARLKLDEVVRAEVGQLVMFPITPDVLHRIEFRSIGRQVVQRQAAPLMGDKFRDQVAAMSLGAIPDYQQPARQMRSKCARKSTTCGARMVAR